MQSSEVLNITRAEYLPESQQYIVSDFLLPKLTPNHIYSKIKDQISPIASQTQLLSKTEKTKKTRLIYPQQMLYLTYVSQYQQYLSIKPNTTRQAWEILKQQDVLKILQNLSETGFNRLQFVQFFIKIRKKSKLIERFLCPANQKIEEQPAFFKIYKTVQNFKQKQKGETFFLAQKSSKISNILKVKQAHCKESCLKLQILSNFDGVVIQLMPSFPINEDTCLKS